MKIAVLMGGTSAEREVSLSSGKAVAAGLRRCGHEVLEVDAALGAIPEGAHPVAEHAGVRRQPPDQHELESYGRRPVFDAVGSLASTDIDAVFIALHGVPGEDGTVQGMLDLAGIAYTGSGLLSSTLAMDKIISKTLFMENGIETPPWHVTGIIEDEVDPHIRSLILDTFGYPVVVKPNDQGSTVGLSIIHKENGLEGAVRQAAAYSTEVLVEQFIPGRELTVSVLGNEALPVIEIHPEHGIYDYECKYTKGKCSYTVPAELPDEITSRTLAMGTKAFNALKCKGFGRVDMRLDEGGRLYCLEVNTIPGMTDTSLVPKAARAVGIEFDRLVETIVQLAVEGREG